MRYKLARMRRRAETLQIRRRADGQLPLIAGNGDGDHVLLDHLAEPDPGIVSMGDDIELLVRDGDVELNFRIGLCEGRQQRTRKKSLGDRRDSQPQLSPRT